MAQYILISTLAVLCYSVAAMPTRHMETGEVESNTQRPAFPDAFDDMFKSETGASNEEKELYFCRLAALMKVSEYLNGLGDEDERYFLEFSTRLEDIHIVSVKKNSTIARLHKQCEDYYTSKYLLTIS